MGCCNELATALETAVVDATQHVNFAKGMVLGVDDFRQEFAYLSGRDQWLVRDAIGYGTLSGLRVYFENDGVQGPRLHVTAGSAFVPSGKQVCVGADQCAVINKWLAKPENAAIVSRLLNGGSPVLSPPLSPPAVTSGTISLFLTLCYQDCLTRPVPVPGEPCRSQDELMADSRVADDYRLELRKDPPVQVEEDALRDFVRWLRTNIHVVDTSPPRPGDDAWLAALRPAAQAWLDAATLSPPLSPPASFSTLGDYLVDLSPGNLTVAQDQVCDLLRVAFRFWVTELRPLWMARRCHREMMQDQDCVLLARVEFDVDFVGGSPTGVWQIAGSPAAMIVDETTRPVLVHMRLLQEWLMCGCECGGLGLAAAPAGGGEFITFGPPILDDSVVAGGIAHTPARVPVAMITASVALDDTHYCVVCTGGGTMTLTLPASLPEIAGRVYVIKNADAKLTVRTAAGTTIDDKLSLTVKKKNAVTVVADGGGGWLIIGQAGA